MDNASDPTVSAVVTLKEREGGPPPMDAVTQVKGKFSGTGFEVHAPFHMSFSIAGKRSVFERVFGTDLEIDEESLAAVVTTKDGSLELPLDQLPEEVRAAVASIAFMPPPSFANISLPPQ